MLIPTTRKSPHRCGLFVLPAATAEAERDARAAISVAASAIVRLAVSATISATVVRPRLIVAVAAAIMRAVVAIAVVPVTAIVTTTRADVGGLLRDIGGRFRLHRVVRSICGGATEQCSCTDGKYDC